MITLEITQGDTLVEERHLYSTDEAIAAGRAAFESAPDLQVSVFDGSDHDNWDAHICAHCGAWNDGHFAKRWQCDQCDQNRVSWVEAGMIENGVKTVIAYA